VASTLLVMLVVLPPPPLLLLVSAMFLLVVLLLLGILCWQVQLRCDTQRATQRTLLNLLCSLRLLLLCIRQLGSRHNSTRPLLQLTCCMAHST
jgi:hypothetical protein